MAASTDPCTVLHSMKRASHICMCSNPCKKPTINRAELNAMICAATIPFGFIHSDSRYAISKSHVHLLESSNFGGLNNASLLAELASVHLDPRRVRKIKAHQDPHSLRDSLEIYHALGNIMAGQAAKTACRELNPAWKSELNTCHTQIAHEREVLHGVYNFTLIWPVLENKTAGGPEVTPVIELLKQWTPEDIQHLSFPASIEEWQADFSWGPWLAQHVFQVMQQVKRPTEPQGPLRAEVGVSGWS